MYYSLCLKISLEELDYPVWRSIVVPGGMDFDVFCRVVLETFGWTGEKASVFLNSGVGNYIWTPIEEEKLKNFELCGVKTVLDYFKNEGIAYFIYDQNEQWLHKIELEEIIESTKPLRHIKCIGGKRHRPPEDVGGLNGYSKFLEIIKDPKHPRYYEKLAWAEKDTAGRMFDPDYFYILEINRRLALF